MIRKLLDLIFEMLETRFQRYTLQIEEKLKGFFTGMLILFAVVGLAMLGLLLLMFALAIVVNNALNSRIWGFVIVGLLAILPSLGGIIWLLVKKNQFTNSRKIKLNIE